MNQPMSRRLLLTRGIKFGTGAVVLGAGLPALLSACGSDSDEASSTTAGESDTTAAAAGGTETTAAAEAPAADFGDVTLRLSWIKNAEFAGEYMADSKGYYTAAGFSGVELLAGGPSAQPAEVDVQSGKAIYGLSAPDLTAAAISQGADLKIIGAQFQKNPFCVMSLASNPITTPEEMYGKTFGLQAANQVVWDSFVKASGIDDSQITKVPAQFDPTPLINGEVDCWFSFVTNEPNLLTQEGIENTFFLIADYGYPLVSEVFVVKTETIENDREKLKALLKAEVMGWHDVYLDPDAAADLTVDVYGKDLGLKKEGTLLELASQDELIWTPDTMANGIFTMTDELIAANIEALNKAGLEVTAEQLFDLSLIDEVYEENPDLKIPPK